MGLLSTTVGGALGGPTGALTGFLGGKAVDAVSGNAVNPSVTGFDPSKTLGPTNALPGQNYFDSRIDSSLIPSQQGRDAGSYSQSFNYGINPDKGELSNPNQLPGAANDPMVQAINDQAAKQTSQALRGITTQNNQAGTMAAGQEQNTVAHEAAAEYQNQVQNFNQQYQYELQRYQMLQQYQQAQSQAQASLWGSVFGGIGKIGGLAAAGA